MNIRKFSGVSIIFLLFSIAAFAQSEFIKAEKGQFVVGGKPYYYVGTNYWYGGLLGLEKDKRRGAERLRRELDFLKANGVTNLRVLGGAEGEGLINDVPRVGPSLQTVQGKFNTEVLNGLDLLLDEMGKRKMKAVVFFSNNWEWSGGFQQYLIWNDRLSKDFLTRKPSWDELRDAVSKFYDCAPCQAAYNEQMNLILDRRNKFNGKKYMDDPTIMAWELANEPRPMRPSANENYKKWIRATAAMIKKKDKNHLVCIGHEGSIGTESLELFEEIHADQNIDYLTIHIWAKNWGWFRDGKLAEDYPQVLEKAAAYVNEHLAVAKKLGKPLVIEEFGLPRDRQSLDVDSTTVYRDKYYEYFLSSLLENAKSNGDLAGINFWAFGGAARPIKNQIFWKKGDDFMGDPPMEEQGLNTVFDSDRSTWMIIDKYSKQIR